LTQPNLKHTVDGGWSVWAGWGGCDVTCGSGTKSRTRTCDDPIPAHGGEYCLGINIDTVVCLVDTCPGIETYYENISREKKIEKTQLLRKLLHTMALFT